MLEGPRATAIRNPFHERDRQATQITTHYDPGQGDTIHLGTMEGNYGESRNRTKTQHGFPSTNRRTDRTDRCHIGTIPTSIPQLSTGRLVRVPTTRRIRVQQRISGHHQDHPFLCKLRNQTRIRDDRSSDPRKAIETRRNESFT